MKKPALISLAVLLVIAGTFGLNPAWKHYSLYRSVQREARAPYTIEAKPSEFFAAMVERRGWHNSPMSVSHPKRSSDRICEELKWQKNLRSVAAFYTTDTRGIGLAQWMLMPRSSILPTLQEMAFATKRGGTLYVDVQSRLAAEFFLPGAVTLFVQKDDGVEEWSLVDDDLYSKMLKKKSHLE